MISSATLSRWWQLCAALPGSHTDRDAEREVPTRLNTKDRETVQRQRVALETLSLGWGDCFRTPTEFFSWPGPKNPRLD
jgi:hypothetical protein